MTDPAAAGDWVDVGTAETLREPPLRQIRVGTQRVALSFRDGVFGAISDRCNHVGGPLGAGRLEGDYVVCPWHAWKFHRCSGDDEPGYEADHVSHYEVRERDGRVEVRASHSTSEALLETAL